LQDADRRTPVKWAALRQRVLRWLPATFVVVAAGLAIYAVVRHGHDLRAAFAKLGALPLLESLGLGLLGTYLVARVWIEIVRGLGARPPLYSSTRAYFVSQLGKYVPGSVWPALAQMEYGRRTKIGRMTMLNANMTALALNVAVGLAVAAACLPFAGPQALRHFWWALLALPFVLALLHPRVLPAALNPVLRRMRRTTIDQRLPWSAVLRAAIWGVLSWILFGLHLYVMARVIDGDSWHLVAACIAGILVIPVPAGAGIRDAVIVVTLAAVMSTSDALAIAIASRVLLILTDLILGAGHGAIPQRRRSTVDRPRADRVIAPSSDAQPGSRGT